jgi:ATP-binding cassette subfamily B protein
VSDRKTQSAARVPGVDGRLLRRIVTYLVPYKGWVVIAFVTVMTAAFLGPLRPKLVQVAIDSYIVTGQLDGLRRIIFWLFLILFGEGLLSFVNAYLTQWIGQQAIFDLRTKLFRHIQRQSDVLSAGVVTIMGDLFRLIFIAYFMFSLNWVLALVTLAVLPLMIRVTFWFRRVVREQYRETRKQVARLNSFVQEHVTGMRIVQLFNREQEELRRFKAINDDHRGAQIRTIFYFALFWPAIDIVGSTALGLVIWVGGIRAMGDALTLGVLIAFIQYARQFFEPIRNLSDQFNTLQSAMAGAERIFDLLDADEALPESDTPNVLDDFKGTIEFEDVWFTYDRDYESDEQANWILKGVSFVVEPGTSTAIVGATGAGKTTIISVLLRFYEIQRGAIRIDGVDIKTLSLSDLRRRIGLVLQDVFLFSGSVIDNITLDDPAISKQKVEEAVSLIGADAFVGRLPRGLDHEVKERGMSLSHGQRQMLSFARALVYNPAILVLDEATSSVDTETEEAIQIALSTLMSGRTSIAIAHRLSTIQHANQILVMHRGEIRERGTHQQLISLDGLYRKLYELQYQDQEQASAA